MVLPPHWLALQKRFGRKRGSRQEHEAEVTVEERRLLKERDEAHDVCERATICKQLYRLRRQRARPRAAGKRLAELPDVGPRMLRDRVAFTRGSSVVHCLARAKVGLAILIAFWYLRSHSSNVCI